MVVFSLIAGCSARGGGSGDITRRDSGEVQVDGSVPDPDSGLTAPDTGVLPDADTPSPDATTGWDAEPVDPCNPVCVPEESCGDDGTGNGIDDNCNGSIDETCACAPGTTRNCFAGPPDRRGVGTCSDGMMGCGEFGQWGPCVGGQSMRDETCDGADNDCNGVNDDGLDACSTTLACPSTQSGAPLNTFALRGSDIYGAPTRRVSWTIECPDTVATCPTPTDASALDTDIYFVQSGSYRARFEVTTEEGEDYSCEWQIRVGAGGLRVELNWDTQGDGRGDTDVDLHLHQQTTISGRETDFFTNDDCYYLNCKGSSYSNAVESAWGLTPTDDLAACEGAPHSEGDAWRERGSCANPRLDVDVVTCDPTTTDGTAYDFCAPENINIDNPRPGYPYRVMVNYFSEHSYSGDTNPTVTIFCNGEQRAMLVPPRPLRDGSGFGAESDNWLVADVVFGDSTSTCGGTDCQIMPLEVVQTGPAFGPNWSF